MVARSRFAMPLVLYLLVVLSTPPAGASVIGAPAIAPVDRGKGDTASACYSVDQAPAEARDCMRVKNVGFWALLAWVPRSLYKEAWKFAASYLASKGLDYALDRSGLIDMGRRSIDELSKHGNSPALNARDRAALDRAEQQIREVLALLEDGRYSDQEVVAIMQSRHGDLEKYFRTQDNQLEGVDRKLFQLELRQRQMGRELAQYQRVIADYRGRIVKLEKHLVDHQQRIVTLEGRVVALEGRIHEVEDRLYVLEGGVYKLEERTAELENRMTRSERRINREHGRYDKHIAYVGGSLVYSRFTAPPIESSVGVSLDLQYNINQYFGLQAAMSAVPLAVPLENALSLRRDTSRTADVLWDNYAAFLGISVSLVPARYALSLQVAAGGGIAIHSLVEVPSESAIYDRSEASELAMQTNPAAMLRVDLGFSPHLFPIEPYLSAGMTAVLDEVSFQSEQFGTAIGTKTWFMSIGVRYRYTPKIK